MRRSRAASSRLTIAASAFPCFSRCAMLMRECAVSAVSLPEKNADSNKQTNTTSSEIQSIAVMKSGEFLAQEFAYFRRIDIRRHEGVADAMHQDESELTAFHLFVLCDQRHEAVGIGKFTGNISKPRWHSNRREVAHHPLGFRRRNQPQARGELERQHNAQSNALAVMQPSGKPGGGLQRVSERMAEIEQRTFPGLAFVARHDAGLHPVAYRNGVLARRIAGEYVLPVRLQ